jgi:hypothetical protein
MAFIPRGSMNPHGAPVLRYATIANSITVVEQCSVKLTSGFVALGTTGALVFGHVVGMVTKEGTGLLSTGIAGAAMGSFVGSYLTASDNQTVGFVKAQVDISKYSLYAATESAAIGTTTGSNLAGYTQDLSDSVTLSESSALATTNQYFGHGVDATNSALALVSILESQVFGV